MTTYCATGDDKVIKLTIFCSQWIKVISFSLLHWHLIESWWASHNSDFNSLSSTLRNELTHWGLVTPYGDSDLGQHWLRLWLVAWRHQAITWTNVDLSVRPSDIHLWASSQKIPQPSITEIIWKIKDVKFHSNFPGANEFIMTEINYHITRVLVDPVYKGRVYPICLRAAHHYHWYHKWSQISEIETSSQHDQIVTSVISDSIITVNVNWIVMLCWCQIMLLINNTS